MTASLLTVGHGNLDRAALGQLLRTAGVDLLVDVRRTPGSRRHPHVNRGELERWLPEHGVGYRWEEDLGGRREPRADSPHVAWADPAFRGYADHLDTDAFRTALGRVLRDAGRRTVAVMCAEADWRRCHRQLIADVVALLHSVEVAHLGPDGRLTPHPVHAAARVVADRIRYDRGASQPGLFGAL